MSKLFDSLQARKNLSKAVRSADQPKDHTAEELLDFHGIAESLNMPSYSGIQKMSDGVFMTFVYLTSFPMTIACSRDSDPKTLESATLLANKYNALIRGGVKDEEEACTKSGLYYFYGEEAERDTEEMMSKGLL